MTASGVGAACMLRVQLVVRRSATVEEARGFVVLREGSERWCRGLGLFAFFSNMERSVNLLLGEGGQVVLAILSLEYVSSSVAHLKVLRSFPFVGRYSTYVGDLTFRGVRGT